MEYKLRRTSVKRHGDYGQYARIDVAYMEEADTFRGAYPGVDMVWSSGDLSSSGRTRRSLFVRIRDDAPVLVDHANLGLLTREQLVAALSEIE